MALSSEPYRTPPAHSAKGAAYRLSLAPGRDRATACVDLCAALLEEDETDTIFGRAFAQGICAVEAALRTHFPNNIFGDLDCIAAALLAEARIHSTPLAHLRQHLALIDELLQLYGSNSPIHFRYAHDFLYGFDWVRWVRKAPDQRGSTGPFATAFLHYLRKRGNELLLLIAADDPAYPRLPHNADRNPFSFLRDPTSEMRLHASLAADGLVPVEAWDARGRQCTQRDYSALREQRADHLLRNHG